MILKNKVLLPVEGKETVNDSDLAGFLDLLNYIKAEKGVIVSSSQRIKEGNGEVIPAYLTELLPERAKT